MSYCELCGREITGPPFRIVVEKVVMNVCRPCSKHGKPYTQKKPKKPREKFTLKFPHVRGDYSKVIREGRKKRGLSQEELGNKIKEGEPVVKLLEQGKFKPDPTMAKKIEDSLGVKLIETSEADE